MGSTVSFLCPNTGGGGSVKCRSGTHYFPSAQGIITNVATGDVLDLLQAGCVPFNNNTVPFWVAGRFYGIPIGSPAVFGVNQLVAAGTLYAYPIFIPNQIELQTLNLGVATGQTGGAGHAGIYTDSAGYPNALVVDSGALAATTGANVSASAGGLQIAAGMYWLASQFTATGTYPTMIGIGGPATVGFDTAAHLFGKTAANNIFGISVAQTYGTGALPATFPTGGAPLVGVNMPIVGLGL